MKGWRPTLNGVLARRIVQAAALLLFFGLILAARRHGDAGPSVWWQGFFLLDPLVLLLTWLAGHAVPAALLLSLATVAVTILLGRVFCGWFCPWGRSTPSPGGSSTSAGRGGSGRNIGRAGNWRSITCCSRCCCRRPAASIGARCSIRWSCLYRTTVAVLLPGMQWALEDGSNVLGLSEPARQLLREHVTEVEHQAFLGSGLILAVFVALLALNRWRPRFWCRYLCPLGALLGAAALRPFLRRRVARGELQPVRPVRIELPWRRLGDARRRLAGRRVLRLPQLHGRVPSRKPGFPPGVALAGDAGRRVRHGIRTARGGGFSAVCAALRGRPRAAWPAMVLFRATPQSRGSTGSENLVRPPGALAEREFLKRCTACGLCMRICPTGCLQPTLGEAGLEGLWTPRVVPRIGRCEYDCTLCGHTCPTGAIAPLTIDEKHAVKIGIALRRPLAVHSLCLRPRLRDMRRGLPLPGEGDPPGRRRSAVP